MGFSRRIILLGALVFLLVYPFIIPSKYFTTLLTQVLVLAIFTTGLNLVVGYLNLVSLGHGALFGAGAYTAALLGKYISHNIFLGLACGTLWACLLTAIFAMISLQVSGVYFIFITLALGQVLWAIIFGWRSLTGGDDGFRVGNPEFWSSLSLSDINSYYYLALLVFCIVSFAVYRIIHSPFGHAIVGIRENESRMRVLGYDVWHHKFVAYVISGAISGLAGVIWAYCNGFVHPNDVGFVTSADAVLIIILGGSGTLFGPIVGTILFVAIKNIVALFTQRWLFVLGLAYILTVLFFPQGIINTLRRVLMRGVGKTEI